MLLSAVVTRKLPSPTFTANLRGLHEAEYQSLKVSELSARNGPRQVQRPSWAAVSDSTRLEDFSLKVFRLDDDRPERECSEGRQDEITEQTCRESSIRSPEPRHEDDEPNNTDRNTDESGSGKAKVCWMPEGYEGGAEEFIPSITGANRKHGKDERDADGDSIHRKSGGPTLRR